MPNTQIGASDAENVFELLKSHDQDHAVGHIVDIRKQSDLEEYAVPEPETNARTVTSFEFDWVGLDWLKLASRCFEETDWNEQRGKSD